MPLPSTLQTILGARVAARRARALEGIYLIGTAVLVFVVPYYIPMKHVVFSPSYDFGFNNRIAVVGALLCVLAAPLFLGRDSEWPPPVTTANEPAPRRRLFYLMAVLHTAGIAFYFLVTSLNGETPDAYYFLGNAISMAQGLRPYRDFEFAYGPGLLYPTHWLNAAGLSVHSAYFLFYLGITYVGLYIAWSFANQLPVRTWIKALVFVLICGISIVSLTTAGVNYTIVRFVTPLWILGKLNAAYMGASPVWTQATIGCLGILLTDLVSPEVGTVFAIAAAVFFGFTCVQDAENRIWRALAMVLCLGLHGLFLFILMPPQFRDSIASFSHGGNNLPFVPSAFDLYYLLGASYCVRQYLPNLSQRNLAFQLILLYGLGSMPGALTHADSGHVAWDGIAILTLLIIASDGRRKSLGWWLALLPVILYALGNPYRPGRSKFSLVAAAVSHKPVSSSSVEELFAVASSFPSSALMLSGNYQLEERLAKVNLRPQYYSGITNVLDPNAVSRAVDNLKETDAAILIASGPTLDLGCPTGAAEQTSLQRWLLFPYSVRRKHNSCEMYAPYIAYVNKEYRPMPGHPELWIKKR